MGISYQEGLLTTRDKPTTPESRTMLITSSLILQVVSRSSDIRSRL